MTTKSLDERIKALTGTDFMMMDVHRPMTDDEIAELHPQAGVDKSAGAQSDDDSDAEGVGAPHTERCPHCFGPMPCEQHANVEVLQGVTSLDINPTVALAGAHAADLEIVVIVGMDKNGREYFSSSVADAAEGMYYLQRGIHKLNKVVDGDYEDDQIGPGRPAA